MKTNGAPENLYLLPNGLISYCRNNNEDIEYVRKDAFIEKAVKWLMDNIEDYTDDGMGERSFVLVQDLKEHFKKYMED